jgi:hypothetical protein
MPHKFELVESSVLNIYKISIHEVAGLADHYFLSELNIMTNSVGWGPNGLELQGKVRVTSQELERIERFIAVVKYDISLNNCEHFANYVLHGLNFSSQQHSWWKSLGANVIGFLQPTQSISENQHSYISHQISEFLNENLKQVKIERANHERIIFWKSRDIDIQ